MDSNQKSRLYTIQDKQMATPLFESSKKTRPIDKVIFILSKRRYLRGFGISDILISDCDIFLVKKYSPLIEWIVVNDLKLLHEKTPFLKTYTS